MTKDMDAEIPLKTLPRSFYNRSALDVARGLLGHYLLRRICGAWTGGPIVETEAYLRDDPACHASRGRSKRNETMFGPPGHAYVYLIYGMYYCVNAVCMPEGVAEAVLIRAIEPRFAPKLMLENRNAAEKNLSNGPGKLCSALAINRRLNGIDLCDPASTLIVARDTNRPALSRVLGPMAVTPRIGITKAAHLPLRFCLKRSRFLSRPIREIPPA